MESSATDAPEYVTIGCVKLCDELPNFKNLRKRPEVSAKPSKSEVGASEAAEKGDESPATMPGETADSETAELADDPAELKQLLAAERARSAELEKLLVAERAASAARELAAAEKSQAKIDAANAKSKEANAKARKYQKESERGKKEIEKLHQKYFEPRLHSGNSSIPPSKSFGGRKREDPETADGEEKEKKKPGSKPGHVAHHHHRMTPHQTVMYKPTSTNCPVCGTQMRRHPSHDTRFQQLDFDNNKVLVVDHCGEAWFCPACKKYHGGKVNDWVKEQGFVSHGFVTYVSDLHRRGLSFRSLSDHFKDVFDVSICPGTLNQIFNDNSEALAVAYEEIEKKIREQKVLHIDETTHKDSGKWWYTWVFVAVGIAILYRIGSRKKDMLRLVLGEGWMGIIVCDYYIAYISYADETPCVYLQHCLAHLKRDFRNCKDHLDPEISKYGAKMLGILAKLFDAWHAYKADRSLKNHMELRKWGAMLNREAVNAAPDWGKPKAIAARFLEYPGSYTMFIEHPGVEPTNNAAERAVRRIIVQRYVTQGTRSPAGMRAMELIWSASATCELQGKSFFKFFKSCLIANHAGEEMPSIFG